MLPMRCESTVEWRNEWKKNMNYTPMYIYIIYYTVNIYIHNEEETTLDFLILLLGGSVLKLSIFRHSFCMIAAY